jgi:hypothetical protein
MLPFDVGLSTLFGIPNQVSNKYWHFWNLKVAYSFIDLLFLFDLVNSLQNIITTLIKFICSVKISTLVKDACSK